MEEKIKFGLIIMCFLICLSYGKNCVSKKDAFVLRIAMFFTVLADFCLLMTDKYVLGVALFCVVQLAYAFRYGGAKALKPLLVFEIFIFIFIHIVLKIELVYTFSAMYALCFCVSLVCVFYVFKHKAMPFVNRVIMLTGMALFAACDINVALFNNPFSFVLAHQSLFFVLIWLFYLPAQILLAFSARRFSTAPEII